MVQLIKDSRMHPLKAFLHDEFLHFSHHQTNNSPPAQNPQSAYFDNSWQSNLLLPELLLEQCRYNSSQRVSCAFVNVTW